MDLESHNSARLISSVGEPQKLAWWMVLEVTILFPIILILFVIYCGTALGVRLVCGKTHHPISTSEEVLPVQEWSHDSSLLRYSAWQVLEGALAAVREVQKSGASAAVSGPPAWKSGLGSFWGVLVIRDMGCAIAPSHFFKDLRYMLAKNGGRAADSWSFWCSNYRCFNFVYKPNQLDPQNRRTCEHWFHVVPPLVDWG